MTTGIPYLDEAWNPMTGCTPVSPGCNHCYARRLVKGRLRGRFGYPANEPFRPTFHPERLDQPLRWRKPRRIGVCFMGDLFHEAFTDEQIARVFAVMALGSPDAILEDGRWRPTAKPHHTYLLCTKRAERMNRLLAPEFPNLIGSVGGIVPIWPMPHVWSGVTVCSQEEADRDIPQLLATPAAVRWVSVEPMLEPVYGDHALHIGYEWSWGDLDWVVLGGETGPGARPMQPEWALDVYRQCTAAGVAVWWKQWGTWAEHHASATVGALRERDSYPMIGTHELPEMTP